MAKVEKHGIKFDSELEVRYYDHLIAKKVKFKYHLKYPITFEFMPKGYKPDFIEFYFETAKEYPSGEIVNSWLCRIVETKGYNQFSAKSDAMIHTSMMSRVKNNPEMLFDWLRKNGINTSSIDRIEYQKIKYLQKHGFVDFKFKAKGLKDQWKTKAEKLEEELKDTKKSLKESERNHAKDLKDIRKYFAYEDSDKKLTSVQSDIQARIKESFLL